MEPIRATAMHEAVGAVVAVLLVRIWRVAGGWSPLRTPRPRLDGAPRPY
jgi:hypothetical protein